jgi:hypothetical protein
VRSLFNRPDLPSPRLHASASATVIRMATDDGIAVIPTIVERELRAASTLIDGSACARTDIRSKLARLSGHAGDRDGLPISR